MQLETCLIAGELTMTLSPPHIGIILTPLGIKHGARASSKAVIRNNVLEMYSNTYVLITVLRIILATANLTALMGALDLLISSIKKCSTELGFAPHPGPCQGGQTVFYL